MLEINIQGIDNQSYLSYFIFLLVFIGLMSALIMVSNYFIGKFFKKIINGKRNSSKGSILRKIIQALLQPQLKMN
jgi:hypothetical protein